MSIDSIVTAVLRRIERDPPIRLATVDSISTTDRRMVTLTSGRQAMCSALPVPPEPGSRVVVAREGTQLVVLGVLTTTAQTAFIRPPDVVHGQVSNGTARAPTTVAARRGLFVAPCPLRMVVTYGGMAGFNAGANRTMLRLRDGTGEHGLGPDMTFHFPESGARRAVAGGGHLDFDTGDEVGFDLLYWVDTSNTYVDVVVTASYHPL